MSVESAWDAELAAAGEVMGDDVQRLLGQADGYSRTVAELRAEVQRMRTYFADIRVPLSGGKTWIDMYDEHAERAK